MLIGSTSLKVLLFNLAYCLDNVASGKPAVQSSIRFSAVPGRAVDGNGELDWGGASCTYSPGTSTHPLPWWRVDLQKVVNIEAVTVVNRGFSQFENNCSFSQRSPSTFVPFTEMYHTTRPRHEIIGSLKTCMIECTMMWACDGFNFNILDSSNDNGTSYCLDNVASGKPAVQSAIGFSADPGLAVDGNGELDFEGSSCTYSPGTSSHPLPWWRVDLQKVINVEAVTIVNRGFSEWEIPPHTITSPPPYSTNFLNATCRPSFSPSAVNTLSSISSKQTEPASISEDDGVALCQ
ncbi:uncharacterized protein LOC125381975 [Haliotis rufescens]|uniref:uncharacterized protein LOC125381975 n=1 Tax=Haliotis rufescens TaxID=6454 RepID=UPI00201E7E9A|nr:uncharacterized protein LOC125381975 [Haliotis rufescens]